MTWISRKIEEANFTKSDLQKGPVALSQQAKQTWRLPKAIRAALYMRKLSGKSTLPPPPPPPRGCGTDCAHVHFPKCKLGKSVPRPSRCLTRSLGGSGYEIANWTDAYMKVALVGEYAAFHQQTQVRLRFCHEKPLRIRTSTNPAAATNQVTRQSRCETKSEERVHLTGRQSWNISRQVA